LKFEDVDGPRKFPHCGVIAFSTQGDALKNGLPKALSLYSLIWQFLAPYSCSKF